MLWRFSIKMWRLFVSTSHRPTSLFYTVSRLSLKKQGDYEETEYEDKSYPEVFHWQLFSEAPRKTGHIFRSIFRTLSNPVKVLNTLLVSTRIKRLCAGASKLTRQEAYVRNR